MTLDQEQAATRTCPNCGAACAAPAGARECPCCGQGYGAQGLVDHVPLADEDAPSFAPVALGAACVVALAAAAAVLITPWALVAVVVLVTLAVVALTLARRGQLDD